MQILQLLLFALLIYSLAVLSKSNPQKIMGQSESLPFLSDTTLNTRLTQIVEEILEHSKVVHDRKIDVTDTNPDLAQELRDLTDRLDALGASLEKFILKISPITEALSKAANAINFQLATPVILGVQTLWMGWLMWRQTNTLVEQTRLHKEKYAKA